VKKSALFRISRYSNKASSGKDLDGGRTRASGTRDIALL